MEERGVVGITENVKTVPRDIIAPREPPLYESQHEERLADFLHCHVPGSTTSMTLMLIFDEVGG